MDRTFQQADPDANDGVNQILGRRLRRVGELGEASRPEQQQAGVPDEIEDDVDGGPAADTIALSYTVTKAENASGTDRAFSTTLEVLPAQDLADDPSGTDNDEDDIDQAVDGRVAGLGNDTLTYSLSGADAKYFVIVGSVDYPTEYDPDGTDGNEAIADEQGELAFKRETKLEYDRPDDKRVYRVTIRATDPSGDQGSNTVDVIVNITDHNERPAVGTPHNGRQEGEVRGERHGPRVPVQRQEPRNAESGAGDQVSACTGIVSNTLDVDADGETIGN